VQSQYSEARFELSTRNPIETCVMPSNPVRA
jgi:hypothetical protein